MPNASQQQQNQSSGHPNNTPMFKYIATALTLIVSILVWWFALTPAKLAEFCSQICAPTIDCAAPIPGNANWITCATALANKTLDPTVFQARVNAASFLGFTSGYAAMQPVSSGVALHVGDQYQIKLHTPISARAYLLHRDHDGKLAVLIRGQSLIAGQDYTFPAASTSYTLAINDVGKATLYLLLFPDEPQQLLDVHIGLINDVITAPGAQARLITLLDGPLLGRYMRFTYDCQASIFIHSTWKLIMKYLLSIRNLSLLSLALLQTASAVLAFEAKGPPGVCAVGVNCTFMAMNTQFSEQFANDINVNYRYSGPLGDGKQRALHSNSVMHTGDCFTIEIKAKRALYLYIIHFDSSKNLHELVSWSKHANHLQAGESFYLPNGNQHFTLQDPIGIETFHTIVSPSPLIGLMQRYRQKLLTDDEVSRYVAKGVVLEPKDIMIANDPVAAKPSTASFVNSSSGKIANNSGHVIACLGGVACRETFVIQHVR